MAQKADPKQDADYVFYSKKNPVSLILYLFTLPILRQCALLPFGFPHILPWTTGLPPLTSKSFLYLRHETLGTQI